MGKTTSQVISKYIEAYEKLSQLTMSVNYLRLCNNKLPPKVHCIMQIDWLTDWLIDWLTDWLIDWLIDYYSTHIFIEYRYIIMLLI